MPLNAVVGLSMRMRRNDLIAVIKNDLGLVGSSAFYSQTSSYR